MLFFVLLQLAELVQAASIHNSVVKHHATLIAPSALTEDDKRQIVTEINKYRSRVLPSATNMLEMVWNKEAAKVAAAFSNKCQWGHNPYWNRKVKDFPVYLGEAIHYKVTVLPVKDAISRAIWDWNREKYNYNYETMSCNRGTCSRYTQMVWASTYAVGCGMSTCRDMEIERKVRTKAQIFVCNFGPQGNHYRAKPYQQGRSCEACPNGYACRTRLCSNRTGLFVSTQQASSTVPPLFFGGSHLTTKALTSPKVDKRAKTKPDGLVTSPAIDGFHFKTLGWTSPAIDQWAILNRVWTSPFIDHPHNVRIKGNAMFPSAPRRPPILTSPAFDFRPAATTTASYTSPAVDNGMIRLKGVDIIEKTSNHKIIDSTTPGVRTLNLHQDKGLIMPNVIKQETTVLATQPMNLNKEASTSSDVHIKLKGHQLPKPTSVGRTAPFIPLIIPTKKAMITPPPLVLGPHTKPLASFPFYHGKNPNPTPVRATPFHDIPVYPTRAFPASPPGLPMPGFVNPTPSPRPSHPTQKPGSKPNSVTKRILTTLCCGGIHGNYTLGPNDTNRIENEDELEKYRTIVHPIPRGQVFTCSSAMAIDILIDPLKLSMYHLSWFAYVHLIKIT